MFRTDLSSDTGFTLVELMVVVLIIGILVAIAIPVFNAARAQAQLRTCQANQRTIEDAIQTWRADKVGNDCSTFGNTVVDVGTVSGQALIPQFFKGFPTCPAATANNRYHLDLTGSTIDGDQSAASWAAGHVHF